MRHKLCDIILIQIEAYSNYENELQVMKHLLKIGHWAPICPDIIPSIPFQEGDNLVIDSIPGDFESQNYFIKYEF